MRRFAGLALTFIGIIGPLAAQTAQTITFDRIPNQFLGTSPFPITAKASSGLPVSFTSSTPAVCRTAGLTPSTVGLYQINFQVPANTPNGDLLIVVSQGGVAGNSAIFPVHNQGR